MTIHTLSFDNLAESRLQALVKKTEADGAAEVIKNALRLYETMIVMQENGDRWLVTTGGMNVVMPWEPFRAVKS